MKARLLKALAWYRVPENKARARRFRNDVVAIVVAAAGIVKTLQQAGVL